jgi:hypothetical protein
MYISNTINEYFGLWNTFRCPRLCSWDGYNARLIYSQQQAAICIRSLIYTMLNPHFSLIQAGSPESNAALYFHSQFFLLKLQIPHTATWIFGWIYFSTYSTSKSTTLRHRNACLHAFAVPPCRPLLWKWLPCRPETSFYGLHFSIDEKMVVDGVRSL